MKIGFEGNSYCIKVTPECQRERIYCDEFKKEINVLLEAAFRFELADEQTRNLILDMVNVHYNSVELFPDFVDNLFKT